MKWHNWISFSTLLIFTGCGPVGFSINDNEEKSNSLSSEDASVNQTGSVGHIKTQKGELQWQTEKLSANEQPQLNFAYELKIPYGRIYASAAQLVQVAAPWACQFIPGIAASSPFHYSAGEIPCGAILDNHWKHLMTVPVEALRGKASGFDYTISGTQIGVLMSRAQHQGAYQEMSLDDLQMKKRMSSRQFGEDVSVRFQPNQESGELEVCVNVPGMTATAKDQKVRAEASRRILGLKTKIGSSLHVFPGKAQYDYARGCFKTTLLLGNDGVDIGLQISQRPVVVNAIHQGLYIKIQDWFLNLVDRIIDFFKSSIRQRVIQQISKDINTILDEDVETGRWFTRIHGEKMVQDLGKRVSRDLQNLIKRAGIPTHPNHVKDMLKDSCRLLKLSGAADWTQEMHRFCEEAVDALSIDLHPFFNHPESAAKGCYRGFARLQDAKTQWWSSQCFFTSKITIKLTSDFSTYQKELQKLLALPLAVHRVPEQWRSYVEQLKIDELTLALVLNEAEKRGFHQLTAQDWQGWIPAFLRTIRAN